MPIRTALDLAIHFNDDSATLIVDRADWKGDDKRFIAISVSANGISANLFSIEHCDRDGSTMPVRTCNSSGTSLTTTTIAMKAAASSSSLEDVNAWLATEPDLDNVVTASEVFVTL